MTWSNLIPPDFDYAMSFEKAVADMRAAMESLPSPPWSGRTLILLSPTEYELLQIELGPGSYAQKQTAREGVRYKRRRARRDTFKAVGGNWLRHYMNSRREELGL